MRWETKKQGTWNSKNSKRGLKKGGKLRISDEGLCGGPRETLFKCVEDRARETE